MNEAQAIRFLLVALASDLPVRLEAEMEVVELEWHKACVETAAVSNDPPLSMRLLGQQEKLRKKLERMKQRYDCLVVALRVLSVADESVESVKENEK